MAYVPRLVIENLVLLSKMPTRSWSLLDKTYTISRYTFIHRLYNEVWPAKEKRQIQDLLLLNEFQLSWGMKMTSMTSSSMDVKRLQIMRSAGQYLYEDFPKELKDLEGTFTTFDNELRWHCETGPMFPDDNDDSYFLNFKFDRDLVPKQHIWWEWEDLVEFPMHPDLMELLCPDELAAIEAEMLSRE